MFEFGPARACGFLFKTWRIIRLSRLCPPHADSGQDSAFRYMHRRRIF